MVDAERTLRNLVIVTAVIVAVAATFASTLLAHRGRLAREAGEALRACGCCDDLAEAP